MSRTISDTTLSRLSAFLKKEMGIVYAPERWSELERGMASAAQQFGFPDTADCIRWLMSAPLSRRQIETLAGFLTVGETYFYRDPHILEITEREILPGILRTRRGKDQRLRIWSAACSTGEEPYTLAILLHRLIPDLSDWQITILATDINPGALQKGMAGVFGRWSFRGTPSWFQTLYFKADNGDRFRVLESVRRMVSFEYLNLAEDGYPSLPTNTNAMDLIFCRNVLIYFDQETKGMVVGKLQRCLVENGWLIVGPAEAVPHGYPGFQTVMFDGATCYRKSAAAHRPAPMQVQTAGLAAHREPVSAVSPPEPVAGEQLPALTPEADAAADAAGYQKAAGLYRLGLYQQAASALRELQRLGDLSFDALTLLVRCEANQGRLGEALALCDDAMKANKLEPALHYLRAEILQEQGMTAEAQLALQRALYLDPKLVLAHFALGNLTLWSGKEERARKHFDNALALLDSFAPDEILEGSEGMTAGRLQEIIRSMPGGGRRAEGGRS